MRRIFTYIFHFRTCSSRQGICLLLLALSACFSTAHAQQTYSFTNCSATGRIGPTQLQVTTAYAATNLSLTATTSPTSGIQIFTAPLTGPYRIEAYGAQGGDGSGSIGGNGAQMIGEFNLTAGMILYVLVGQRGISQPGVFANDAGAGGGGSFVTDNNNIPYVVAGGGGGAGLNYVGLTGTVSLNGTQSSLSSGVGGINGGGGGAGLYGTAGTNLLAGGTGTSCSYGNGGGGFYTRGGDNCGAISTLSGGNSYISGGLGGLAQTPYSGVEGGFGCGGGTGHRASGGGGWSGGGGDGSMNGNMGSGGGGAGSYNIGTNQNNVSGANAGHGRVIITELCNISAVGPAPICIGQSATLTTNAISNYSWSTGSTTSMTIVSPTITTTYSVTGQSTMNCSSSNFVTVIVTPQLNLNISASSPSACVGNSITLTANGSGGVPNYTYNWTSGPSSTAYNLSQPAGNYTHTVTMTDANNCVLTQTAAVSFFSNPVLNVPNPSICLGSVASLTVSGASTYTWYPGGSNGSSFSPSPTVATVYSVTGTAASGCSTSATASVSIIPVPALSFATASITCSNLGSATVSAAGGTGPFSYTWVPTFQTNSVATGLNPNTYTLTVLDNGTGCVLTSTTAFSSLIPLTGTLNASSSLTCNGASTGTANYTNLAGGSPVQNYLWTNGTSTVTSFPAIGLTAGNWTSTVTDALTGCILSNTFTITQPTAFTLSIAPSTPTACVGSGIVLTGTNAGGTPGYTYSWINGPTGNTHTVAEITGGNYTYSLNSVDAANCPITGTITVGFINNPVLSITNASICPLETGTVSATGATSYTWNSVSPGASFSDNPIVTTVYSVTGAAAGCTSAATASIILKPLPVPLIGSNSPVCEAGSLQLSAGGGASYAWAGPSAFGSGVQNPTINPVGLGYAGVYNVTVTAANSCTAPASTTVIINPTPALAATGSTVCTIQTANLSSTVAAGTSVQWSGLNGFSSAQQNTVLVNPSLNASGSYTVLATSVAGCTNVTSVNVSVVLPPFLSAPLSSNSICAQGFNGSPNTLTLSPLGASFYTLVAPPYLLNSSPNGAVMPLSSLLPTLPFPAVTSVTLFGSNGVCTVSITSSFSVIPNPTVTINSFTPAICTGQSFTYQSSGATSYTWGPSPDLSTYTNPVTVANPTATTVYAITGSSQGCNSSTQTSTLTVYPIPTTSVTPGSTVICQALTAILTASGSSTSYSWSPPIGLSSVSGRTVIAKPLSNQVYTVTGSANNCTSTAVVSVYVLGLPNPQITPPNTSVCVNDTITLKGSGGFIYQWQGPYGLNRFGDSLHFKADNIARTGSYTLTVTDSAGCKNSVITYVAVNKLPYVNLLGLKTGCIHFCTDYELNSDVSSIVARWDVNDQNFTGNKFTSCFSKTGENIITGHFRDSLSTCLNTQTYTITVFEAPTANFRWEPETPVEDVDEVHFLNESQGEEGWSWYFINNYGRTSGRENPSLNFEDPGVYPVALVVRNARGCSDTLVKNITVAPDFNIYIPNTFTPNGDELNDFFMPVIRNASGYSFRVFDRWGQNMFVTTDMKAGLDGRNKGTVCANGIYIWTIELTTINGEKKEYKGQVTLIKGER